MKQIYNHAYIVDDLRAKIEIEWSAPDGFSQDWKDDLHERLDRVKTTPCPGCGQLGGQTESHPATGVMVNCGCGVRSMLNEWLAGIVALRRNPNGTYRMVRGR